jgi:hypothetical protein
MLEKGAVTIIGILHGVCYEVTQKGELERSTVVDDCLLMEDHLMRCYCCLTTTSWRKEPE